MLKMPELIRLNDHNGNWEVYLNIIYDCFKNDFIDRKLFFKGIKLGLKKHPKFQDKEATFWHFITEGNVEEKRNPEMRRCERIKWPRCIIENCENNEIKIWENERKKKFNICLCYGDWEYLVILRKGNGYIIPWTAYPIIQNHRKRKIKGEYKKFLKKQTPPQK
ncbi:MAG: hypothetical protein V1688_00410 [bacterium]